MDPLNPDQVQPRWRSVSPRLAWIQVIATLFWVIVIIAGFGVVRSWDTSGRLWPIAVALVALTLVRGGTAVRSVRSWGYAERDDDLLVRHGLLVRRLSIIPYARMQFVDVSAGPLERVLGLATVTMHTAAAASDARVPGLAGPEASRLRDRLAALGETRSEGL